MTKEQKAFVSKLQSINFGFGKAKTVMTPFGPVATTIKSPDGKEMKLVSGGFVTVECPIHQPRQQNEQNQQVVTE